MKPVCLVLGAGAGIGGNTAHRFASEGYHVALCRRSNQEGLDNMVKSIESEGKYTGNPARSITDISKIQAFFKKEILE